jgi:hypothetical protein
LRRPRLRLRERLLQPLRRERRLAQPHAGASKIAFAERAGERQVIQWIWPQSCTTTSDRRHQLCSRTSQRISEKHKK